MTSAVLSYAVWSLLAASMVGLQVVGLRSRHRWPSLGDTFGFVMRRSAGRWLVLLAWVWLGVHVFAR